MRLLAITLAIISLQSPEGSTIRVPVRLVPVPTLVFSPNGQVVSGLEAHDFTVRDNGAEQRIELQDAVSPPSVVVVIQSNSAVNDYLGFIRKTGSLVDTLLVGEGGRSAIVSYGDQVKVVKTLGTGDCTSALRNLQVQGTGAHMLDAGMEAVQLLSAEEPVHPRILLFVGQPQDDGSSAGLDALKEKAARANVAIHCLTLPLATRKFIGETFSISGKDGRGISAGVNMIKLVPVLQKGAKRAERSDPFSILAATTGGTQIGFRKQDQLENALIAMGTVIRSSYLLFYTPSNSDPGYHHVSVAVDKQQDRVYSRPGYWTN